MSNEAHDHGDEDDVVPGWDAIDAHFDVAYPDQPEPLHYGTILKWVLGGDDPIDGISIYRATDPVPHWHYVTYGYSDLYGENLSDDPEAESGYGIEMTMRLADPAVTDPEQSAPQWPVNLLQNIARYVFTSGNVIYAGHHLNANGPIALETDTKLTALAFTDDPIGTPIHTPSGIVRFVQAVGITEQELDDCIAWDTEKVLDVIGQRWARGITFLDRPGLDSDPQLQKLIEEGIARDGSSMSAINVETMNVGFEGDELAVTFSSYAISKVAATVASRVPFGRYLRCFGSDQVLQFLPEDGVLVRKGSDEEEGARLSLTPDGVAAMAKIPSAPGEYRLEEIPGVVWKVVPTE